MTGAARSAHQSGFSLIEVVISLAIGSLVMVALAGWLQGPLMATLDNRERSGWLDQSRLVMQRLETDLAQALPNSLRVACGGRCLEQQRVIASGIYRAESPPDTPLRFGEVTDHFDVLGPLAMAPAAGLWAVVGAQEATGNAPLGAYASGSSAVRARLEAGSSTTRLRYAAHSFPLPSPSRSVHLVDGAVSWLCDPNRGTLRRHDGYGIAAVQPQNTALGAIIADQLLDCRFTLDGTGLVGIELVFGDGELAPMTVYRQLATALQP